MKIQTVLLVRSIEDAFDAANCGYDGNLTLMLNSAHKMPRKGCYAYALRLGVKSSALRGARRSPHTNRRIAPACWHAYRDFLSELFKRDPDARVRTKLALYAGATDFTQNFEATGDANIGSMLAPVSYRAACECGERSST